MQRELSEVGRHKLVDSLFVSGTHLAHACQLRSIGDLVEFDGSCHCHPRSKMRKSNLDQLLRIQRAVVVAALADRARQHHTSSVDRLPDVLLVYPSSDLLDQNWCQALRPQLLVHAEEIDLGHLYHGVIDLNVRGDPGDEADQFASSFHANPQMPFSKIAWRFQSPPQKCDGVVEAEHTVIVLNVVLAQEYVDFFGLVFVVNVAGAPLELLRESVRTISDILGRLNLVNGTTVCGVL
mmetsp:Transcript_43179/g.94141  ORF Transcript_43179/g.94141 Transcript_43179/m.94141 type:complete len:237 (-) Transcript_43179:416-1126(-)